MDEKVQGPKKSLPCTLKLSWIQLITTPSIYLCMTFTSLLQDCLAVLDFLSVSWSYYPFQSQVLGAGAYQSYIWAKVQPWVTSSSQGPMLELGGPVPCSTLPQRCSEGILALPPTAITFSMFCCASSPWTKNPPFVSPVHRSENDYNVFCAKQKSQYQSMWNWMNLATE